MSESKTYVFDTNSSGTNIGGMLGYLAPLLQQRGVDPNMLLAMNNRNGWGNDGYGFIWLLFLLFFMNNGNWGGWGNSNGGFGRNGGIGFLSDQLNNDTGRELLMQAINGNRDAISQLSSTLSCSIGDVQQAINGLNTQLCNIGNQVGMSSMQVINAIQSGNASLASQLASCCCTIQKEISDCCCTIQRDIATTNSGLERGFSSLAYATQQQTCDIEKAIQSSTSQILEGQRASELRALQDKLDGLRERNSTLTTQLNLEHQNQYTAGVIGQAVAPINAALSGLQKEVDDIKCKMPDTATVAYSPVTAVPTCSAFNYGINGLGWGFGTGWGWNNCGCSNSLWG